MASSRPLFLLKFENIWLIIIFGLMALNRPPFLFKFEDIWLFAYLIRWPRFYFPKIG